MLKKLHIGARLGLGFAVAFVLFILVSFIIINRMEFLSSLTSMMYKHPLTVSNAVLRVDGNIIRIHRSMKDVALAKNDAEIDEASQIVDRYEAEIYKDFEIITERFLGEKMMYEEAIRAFREWKPIRDEVIALMYQEKRDEAAAITKGKGARHVDRLNRAMLALNDFAQNKAKSFLDDTLETRANTLRTMYTLVAGSIFIGIVFVTYLTRSITKPLIMLMGAVHEISQGHLDKTIVIKLDDEIGQLATAFNEMAGKLKESYTGLEEKVHLRTEALDTANKELEKEIIERKRMEEALKVLNQSLEEMVYIASHDLQVPLVSMEGYASELLEDYKDRLDDNGIYCLTRLQANAQRMHALVLSLLDISRLNTRKNPYESFEPRKVLEDIFRDLELAIDQAEATIEVKEIPPMYGDKQRIAIVLRNLLLNALIYGGKQITVGSKDGRYYIRDDGIGIPASQLEKIFIPGERLKIIDTEGVGMGLTFCKKVITQHGGTIWAESEGTDTGTTFYFTLNA